jgi:hypothetical protein
MAAPYTTPIPGVGNYGQTALGAKTAYDTALRKINDRRSQTLRQSGYLGDIDANTGVLSNMRVDPYNQYGGLQQMLRGQAQAAQGAHFDAQERGLHGGLAHKAESQLQYDAGQQSAQFGQGLTDQFGGLQDEQNQAAYDRDSALWQAEQQAAQTAIDNGDFTPANFSDAQYPDYGDFTTNPPSPYTPGGVKKGVVGKGPGSSIYSGGAYISRNALIQKLMANKVKPSTWAGNHPQAAAQMGISPTLNANNKIIKQALAAAKRKKGGR